MVSRRPWLGRGEQCADHLRVGLRRDGHSAEITLALARFAFREMTLPGTCRDDFSGPCDLASLGGTLVGFLFGHVDLVCFRGTWKERPATRAPHGRNVVFGKTWWSG